MLLMTGPSHERECILQEYTDVFSVQEVRNWYQSQQGSVSESPETTISACTFRIKTKTRNWKNDTQRCDWRRKSFVGLASTHCFKGNGELRICVDLREANKVVIRESWFPIPRWSKICCVNSVEQRCFNIRPKGSISASTVVRGGKRDRFFLWQLERSTS